MTDPFVPVDDDSLDLIEEALNYTIVGRDEEGNPVGSGEFNMHQLLDFWSGKDESKFEDQGETNGVRFKVYRGGYLLDHTSVIRALIDEVRRLRGAA